MNSRFCEGCRTETFFSAAHYGMICQCVLDRERQAAQAAKSTNQSTLFQVDVHEAEFLQHCLEAYRSLDEVTITIDGISRMVNITPRRSLSPSRYPSTKTHPAMSELVRVTIADFSEAKRAAFGRTRRKRGR